MSKNVGFVKLLEEFGPPPKVIRLNVKNQRNRVYVDFLLENAMLIKDFLEDESVSLLEFTSLKI